MNAETLTAILAGAAALAGPLTAYIIAKRKAGVSEFDSILEARKELSAEYKEELAATKEALSNLEAAEKECRERSDKLEADNKVLKARLDRLEVLLDPAVNNWFTPNLARLAWNVPAGFAIVGADGRWLSVNEEMVQITGYTKGELEGGMTFQDITLDGDLESDVVMTNQVKSGEIDHYTQEKTYNRKTRNSRFPFGIANVVLFVQGIRDVNGKFVAFLSFVTPVENQTPNWRE